MNKILISIIVIYCSVFLTAETNGEYGFQILKLNAGAESAASGGTGEFHSNDAFGFLQNPAAALLAPHKSISISQNYWIFDTIVNSGAYVNPRGKTSFGFSYRYLDYGKIDNRDDTGTIIGEYHPMDLILTTNLGYRLTPDHFLAVNFSGLYEKIDTSSSLGLACDLGYLYKTHIKNLYLSASLKNLGVTSKMDEEKIDLPISGDLGLSYARMMNNFTLSIAQKFIKHIDDDGVKSATGIKLTYNEMLALKLGYKLNYDAEDLHAGFGIELHKIAFDYAYIPLKEGFEDAHMFQLTYKF